jgi:hypothetical protein
VARKKKSREQKKREKQAWLTSREDRWWEPFQKVLALLLLPPAVLRFVQECKWWFRTHPYAPPEVLLDPSASALPGADCLCEDMENALDRVCLDADPSVSASTFLAVAAPLRKFLAGFHSQDTGPEQRELTRRSHEAAAQLTTIGENLMEKLISALEQASVAHSRIETKFFWFTDRYESCSSPTGGRVYRVRVTGEPCQRKNIYLDGNPRPVYRCAAWFDEGIRWTSWDATALGIVSPGETYEVYIQAHAIEQFHRRIRIHAECLVRYEMMRSLAEPVVVERRGRTLLVEYRFLRRRLGYFVAEPVDDIDFDEMKCFVLVRTFLFLTMQGTPEARLLKEKFGLSQPDIEYLDLDELKCFLDTDLKNDPELVRRFDECGCGHLLRMTELNFQDELVQGIARRTRKYLRLDDES